MSVAQLQEFADYYDMPLGAVSLMALAARDGLEVHRDDWGNAEKLVERGWATLVAIKGKRANKALSLTPAGLAHFKKRTPRAQNLQT